MQQRPWWIILVTDLLRARGVDRKGTSPSLLCPWQLMVSVAHSEGHAGTHPSQPWKWLSFWSAVKTPSSEVTRDAQAAGPNSNVTVTARMGPSHKVTCRLGNTILEAPISVLWALYSTQPQMLFPQTGTSLLFPQTGTSQSGSSLTLGLYNSTCGLSCP